MTFTYAEKLECAQRELRFRRRVYSRMVLRGKMSPEKREREIELMESIVEDYRVAADLDPEFALFIETKRTVKEKRP